MRTSIPILLLIAASLLSCSPSGNSGKIALPNVTGRNGEVLVIMNEGIKADTSGGYLRAMLTDDFVGLSASEPLFDFQSIPLRHLTGDMKTFRNIINVEVSDSISRDTVNFYNDYWATPQAFINVRAHSKEALLSTLERNHIKIVGFLTKSERDRMIAFNHRTGNNAISKDLSEKYGVNIVVPNTFSRCNPKHPDDMSWININTDEYQCGLFMYSFDYTSEDCLSKTFLMNKRDQLLRDNVEGPGGSYMCTEIRYGLDETIYKAGNYNGMYVAELRGLWRTEGYAMGGPFVLRAHLDQKRGKVIVTDGYVYYPSKQRKRNLIRQLEAVMYSLELPKEENKE
ncbi:MAG: DUF4837 family protein [Bacteroidales bacterium]|nr:DUF4837 family protein [Bacteroidales bacterium]